MDQLHVIFNTLSSAECKEKQMYKQRFKFPNFVFDVLSTIWYFVIKPINQI